jgi:hypothetical protein
VGVAHAAYMLTCNTALRSVVPKGFRNVAYRQFIKELTHKHMALMRPQEIFQTASMRCDRHSDLKIWLVTSRADILMTMWCLKSLFLYSKEMWDVWIADSGDINSEQTKLLERHFPGIRILPRSHLDARSFEPTKPYPNNTWLRHTRKFALSLKLFDPIFNLGEGRFLLLDSDILFFQQPSEIINSLRVPDARIPFHFNIEPSGKINSGLVVIDKNALNLAEIDRVLASMTSRQRNSWTVEQDIYSEIAKGRYAALPPFYAVQPIDDNVHLNAISCHYIGVCRHQFYKQGINRLRTQDFLENCR